MKKIFPYFFLVLFLGISFQHLLVMGVYVMIQEFITDQFCINKDKPELKCNGKCHLNDAIAQQSEAEQSSNFVKHIIIPVFFSSCQQELPEPSFRIVKYTLWYHSLTNTYEEEFLDPPQFIV